MISSSGWDRKPGTGNPFAYLSGTTANYSINANIKENPRFFVWIRHRWPLKTLLLSQTSRHVIIYLEHYCHPNIFQLVLRRQIRSIIGVTRTREWVTAVWNVQLLPSLSECAGPLSIPFKVPDSSPRSRWTFHTAIMALPLRLVPREGFPTLGSSVWIRIYKRILSLLL